MSAIKYPKIAGYELIEQIGGGGFSIVFRAANISASRTAACKVIKINASTTDKERKTVEKEMRVHSALKHTNILEFINAVVVELKHQHVYHPGIYMLLELAAGGDLFDKIEPDVGVGDDVAHLYFCQLVSGVEYMHSQGVCHRDLKPENLLLDGSGTLKISDFGLSAVYKLMNTGKTRTLTERCGSLPYIAPELAVEAPYQAEPIDVWGIGVILYTMLAGNTPWDEPTKRSPEFVRYVKGQIFREAPWNRFGENVLALLTGMLALDPVERMNLEEVQQHAWCIRPSQLARQSQQALAMSLTQGLRDSGDLDVAAPDMTSMDVDGDENMASYASQFTQSLMLFSQSQHGAARYLPNLTRFYARGFPVDIANLIAQALDKLEIKVRPAPMNEDGVAQMRIGGADSRRVIFKGWLRVESFVYSDIQCSLCVMDRTEGDPISWRRVWKQLIQSPEVGPYVVRKTTEF